MSKLKFIQLSQVCKFVNEKVDISGVNTENYISTENMVQNKGGVTSASSLPNTKSVTSYNCNDILTSNIRPYFRKIWFATKNGGCSNDVLVFRPKKDVNAKFLYYSLSDNNFFNYAMVNSKGTKMPRGSKQAIMKYMIPEFPESTQQKIADILSAYDDLIENNNRRIEILEKTAENIYKEWFVRFHFPEYEKAKFENGLPQGWEVRNIGDIVEVGRGSSPRPIIDTKYFENGNIPWIKIADATNSKIYILETKEYINEYGASFSRKLPKGSLILAASGTLGFPMFLGVEGCIHDGWLYFSNFKIITSEYLYYILIMLRDTFNSVSYGAAIQNINTGIVKKTKIIIPDKIILDLFTKNVGMLHTQIKIIQEKNRNLIKQRDLLLPRLMSGKIEV